MSAHYTDVTRILQDKFLPNSCSENTESKNQQLKNILCSLNAFLAFNGKTTNSQIGPEFNKNFDSSLKTYLESISLTERTKRDRKNHLIMIRKIIINLQTKSDTAEKLNREVSLSERLREEISRTGKPIKEIAREIGATPSTISSWLRGAIPNQRGLPTLRRLESMLNLERDSLAAAALTPPSQPTKPIPFRTNLSKHRDKSKPTYKLENSEQFMSEWADLLKYKTTSVPSLKRIVRGKWRLIHERISTVFTEMSKIGCYTCPSAAILESHLKRFFSVISKHPVFGKIEPTLALLVSTDAIEFYLQNISDSSCGIQHNGHRVFARSVASLVRPETGYIFQSPQFMDKFSSEIEPNINKSWEAICVECHTYLRSVIRESTGINRSPTDPIQHLLDSPLPLKSLLDIIRQLDIKAAESTEGSELEAIYKRDALLIGLLISNPLRVRTLASLTWHPDGSGTIVQGGTTGWRIKLNSHHLKNGASKRRQYDVPIPNWLVSRLENYIFCYRDVFSASSESSFLFITNSQDKNKPWGGIGARVRLLTKKFIPGCAGFGPHAIRHLVATDWLRRFPGEYLSVSELLHDNLSTVIENYAHLKADDTFSRHQDSIELIINSKT